LKKVSADNQEPAITHAWIVNGIPGAGKSTFARALAARLPRAVHVEGDSLQRLIISGSVPPGAAPPDEERRQIHLNVRNQCLLALSFAQDGFVPVLDYVLVNRARVEEYRLLLCGLTLRLVTLAPGVEIALRRDRERLEKTVAASWIHLHEQMQAELRGLGLWIDNSNLTIDQTVDCVLSNAEAARI
jgi:predicted kinase